MKYKSIKIYSTSTCPYCIQVKDFLKKKMVEFEDIDVGADEKAAKELVDISGQMGVPVTILEKDDGQKQTIIGFDQAALEDALKN
ncbi:glutaredoxin family protein [Patescibacteria group bacterium]